MKGFKNALYGQRKMKTKIGYAITMIVILCIGGMLRFYNVLDKGIFFWDEGRYYGEAQFISLYPKMLKALSNCGSTVEKKLVITTYAKKMNESGALTLLYAKPLHSLLTMVFINILHNKHGGCAMSAFFGLLSIALVFIFAQRLFNTHFAIVSALIMCLLPLHILYSREAMPEIDSSFFFLVSTLLLYLGIRKDKDSLWLLLFSGFFSGLAFASNYRWIVIPIIAGALLLIYQFHRKKLIHRLSLLICFLLGFSAPLITFHLHSIQWINDARRLQLSLSQYSYLEQLKLWTVNQPGFSLIPLSKLLSLPIIIFSYFGISGGILLFVSPVFALMKKNTQTLFFLVPLFLVMLFYSLSNCIFARMISLVLPHAAIACAYSIFSSGDVLRLLPRCDGARKTKFAKLVIGIVVGTIFLAEVTSCNVKIVQMISPFIKLSQSCEGIIQGKNVVTDSPYVVMLYIPKNKITTISSEVDETLINSDTIIASSYQGSVNRKEGMYTLRRQDTMHSKMAQYLFKEIPFEEEDVEKEFLWHFACEHNQNIFETIRFCKSSKRRDASIFLYSK